MLGPCLLRQVSLVRGFVHLTRGRVDDVGTQPLCSGPDSVSPGEKAQPQNAELLLGTYPITPRISGFNDNVDFVDKTANCPELDGHSLPLSYSHQLGQLESSEDLWLPGLAMDAVAGTCWAARQTTSMWPLGSPGLSHNMVATKGETPERERQRERENKLPCPTSSLISLGIISADFSLSRKPQRPHCSPNPHLTLRSMGEETDPLLVEEWQVPREHKGPELFLLPFWEITICHIGPLS